MADLDDAKDLDLEKRARELAEEAEQLRKAEPDPVLEEESKRAANEDLDRRLEEPLKKLRKFSS